MLARRYKPPKSRPPESGARQAVIANSMLAMLTDRPLPAEKVITGWLQAVGGGDSATAASSPTQASLIEVECGGGPAMLRSVMYTRRQPIAPPSERPSEAAHPSR